MVVSKSAGAHVPDPLLGVRGHFRIHWGEKESHKCIGQRHIEGLVRRIRGTRECYTPEIRFSTGPESRKQNAERDFVLTNECMLLGLQ